MSVGDTKLKVLYIDDEGVNLLAFKANFRRDYRVFTAESAEQGLKVMEEHQPDVVIADQRMPQMTGVEFFEQILQSYPDSIRILLTGFSDINDVIDAINKGQVYSYVTKPWNQDELARTIESAREASILRVSNQQLLSNYHSLFDLTSDPVVLVDLQCKPLSANKALLDMLGLQAEALLNMDASQLFEDPASLSSKLSAETVLEGEPIMVQQAGGTSLSCRCFTGDLSYAKRRGTPLQLILQKQ